MRIVPPSMWAVPAHVRDTGVKFLGINEYTFCMLGTYRRCFRIDKTSFVSTMLLGGWKGIYETTNVYQSGSQTLASRSLASADVLHLCSLGCGLVT